MRHIHFGSQLTHLEESTKTNHLLNRTLVTQNGIAEARWELIKSSKYDIIFFVEDDNIIEPMLPYTSWLFFDKNPKIFAVGCNTLLPIGKSRPQDFKVVESAFAIGKQDNSATKDVTVDRGFAWGAGLAVRKNMCLHII
jgi:cellulose synthase/poly-beta-1,6-N-acetylglucosamine synthase-like glycosyltransferase